MNILRPTRALSSIAATIIISHALMGGVGHANAEIPDELEQIVYGDEKRPVSNITVTGQMFDSLASFASTPYLIWPADETQVAPFRKEIAAVTVWLNQSAPELGYAGFEASFTRQSTWRANTVWHFELMRKGLTLFDARLEVHWDRKTFIGIVIHIPGDVAAIEDRNDAAEDDGLERVYYPVLTEPKTYRLVPSQVTRTDRGDRVEISINAPDTHMRRIAFKPGMPLAKGFEFKEYDVPQGSFPDQISVNVDGVVWLSQPNNDLVTKFDPVTETFSQYPTTGGSGPDGLIVGTANRVWTGL